MNSSFKFTLVILGAVIYFTNAFWWSRVFLDFDGSISLVDKAFGVLVGIIVSTMLLWLVIGVLYWIIIAFTNAIRWALE